MQKLHELISRILGPMCKDMHTSMWSCKCETQIQINSKTDDMGTIKNKILKEYTANSEDIQLPPYSA
jgi:hypothetical protein